MSEDVRTACPLYGKCGGCSFSSLEDKIRFLKNGILAINPEIEFEEPVTGPQLGYRSRARFRYTSQGLCFFEEKSNTNVVIKHCPVLDEKLNEFLQNPPKLNIWELEDGQLSCISTDKKVVYGSDMGWVTVKGRKLPVAGDIFFQSNRILLPQLLDYVTENVVGPNVMDLYAGVGTFSAFLEDRYSVTAVEINKKCLSLAKQHLKKTEFFSSPVERWNPKKTHVNTIIVDPPRVGLDRKVPSLIASWNPQRIIYVSCYIPTMLRDISRLKDLGFIPKKVRVFDFYPGTSHVETVVLLRRVNIDSHIGIDLNVSKISR